MLLNPSRRSVVPGEDEHLQPVSAEAPEVSFALPVDQTHKLLQPVVPGVLRQGDVGERFVAVEVAFRQLRDSGAKDARQLETAAAVVAADLQVCP